MSLLDRVEGTVISHGAAAVFEMLQKYPGGARGLAEAMNQSGMSHLVLSWAGPGENLKVATDQLQSLLGEEHVAAVAEKLGISQQEASEKIAEFLPLVMSGELHTD
jgi:uncharacterized protein YidB (DUF937 family)